MRSGILGRRSRAIARDIRRDAQHAPRRANFQRASRPRKARRRMRHAKALRDELQAKRQHRQPGKGAQTTAGEKAGGKHGSGILVGKQRFGNDPDQVLLIQSRAVTISRAGCHRRYAVVRSQAKRMGMSRQP